MRHSLPRIRCWGGSVVFAGLVSLLMAGCSHALWQMGQWPGLSGISQRMSERSFIRQVTGNPSDEVSSCVRRGQYQFKGLVINDSDRKWVPGLSSEQYTIYQVVWTPVIPGEERTALAEKYYRQFNLLMLDARRGVKLDCYGNAASN